MLGSAAHAAEMRVPNAEDVNAKIVDGNVLEISAFDAQGQVIPVSDFADLFNFEIESSIAGVNADLGTDTNLASAVIDAQVIRPDGGQDTVVGIEDVLGSILMTSSLVMVKLISLTVEMAMTFSMAVWEQTSS